MEKKEKASSKGLVCVTLLVGSGMAQDSHQACGGRGQPTLPSYKSPWTQLEPVKGCAHPAESDAWRAASSLRGGGGSASVCLCVCTIVCVPTVQRCLCVLVCVSMYMDWLASVCSIHVWGGMYAYGFPHVPYAFVSCVIIGG